MMYPLSNTIITELYIVFIFTCYYLYIIYYISRIMRFFFFSYIIITCTFINKSQNSTLPSLHLYRICWKKFCHSKKKSSIGVYKKLKTTCFQRFISKFRNLCKKYHSSSKGKTPIFSKFIPKIVILLVN